MSSYCSFAKEARLENWKRLLGIEDGPIVARFESVSSKDAQKYAKNRVIVQDVMRTRADEPFFRSNLVRSVLRQTLVRFCSFHKIDYLQGLNEVLAPIFTLDESIVSDIEKQSCPLSSSSNDNFSNEELNIAHPFSLNLVIFERMMAKLSPTTFSTLGVNAIQVQLTTFHLLLMYHEPVLATILRKEGMTPDIYAMSWLITLFGRRQPLHRALHIWDLLLQLDKPYITVYLAVALVRSRKASILNNSADVLPATLVALKFETDEEIDIVFADALHLMHITPANVTEELAELGFSCQIPEAMREKGLKDLWHRPCVLSSASDIARVLACADHSVDAAGRPTASPRYVLLDCRHSVEKQLLDALYIESSVSVPLSIQEEICTLARVKSQLLEREGMESEGTMSVVEIEKSFGRAIGQLSTRAAAVLSLLWAAFVSSTTEEVHFAIADDSQGPYVCTDSPQSLLNTSYALPYHTACGASDQSLHTHPGPAKGSSLPQYLTNSSVLASNNYAISLASALITLGFPRVSIVQAEVIHKRRMSSNENSMFTCTDSNSVSSLPIMHAEQYTSGFACVLHYLGALGVNSSTVNARYSYVQTPVDHFKEFQTAALVYELRSTVLQYEHIDVDFYAEDLSTQSVSTPRPEVVAHTGQSHRGPSPRAPPTQTFSSISLVGAVFGAVSSGNNTNQARQPRRHSHHGSYTSQQSLHTQSKSVGVMKKSSSGSGLSSLTNSFGLTTPSGGEGGSMTRQQSKQNLLEPPSKAATRSVSEGIAGMMAGKVLPLSPNSNTTSASIVPVGLMQAKLNCSLDVLIRLLFIMSAQKKHHICRLIVGSFFHSSVPLGRQHSPHMAVSPHSSAHPGVEDYYHLLGAPPDSDEAGNNRNNAVYYAKLESLLGLRDTLHELNNTQRLNATLDKTTSKALSQLRLLKNSIDHSNKQSSRAAAVLTRKTTLRSTQRRLHEESHLRARGDSTSSSGGMWYTDREVSTFLHPEGVNSRCSSAALRDSLSTDWDTSRVLSDDSIDHYSVG